MNRYQEYLLEGFSRNCSLKNCEESIWKNGTLILKQNADITIKDYVLCVSNANIEAVLAVSDTMEIPFEKQDDRFTMPIDFEKKIKSVKIVFKNGLADDLIVPVEYVEADKEAYYAQKEKERKEALLAAAAIKCSTGADLVNIYFQPCREGYAKTEIVLYRDNQLLAKYKVDEDCFFKSIGGLAYGKYGFVLKQFDKAGKAILETEQVFFTISGDGNGKPMVII